MDFNITKEDVKNFFNQQQKQARPTTNAQTAINKQMTINNAIATRGGQAPQGIPQSPTSDGFGRTV